MGLIRNKFRDLYNADPEKYLNSIIYEWNILSHIKNDLDTAVDINLSIIKLQQIANKLILDNPHLSRKIFSNYYDDAIEDVIEFKIKRNLTPETQFNSGINVIKHNGDIEYLFMWE